MLAWLVSLLVSTRRCCSNIYTSEVQFRAIRVIVIEFGTEIDRNQIISDQCSEDVVILETNKFIRTIGDDYIRPTVNNDTYN